MSVTLWQGDCLELMKNIPDGSVDLILCDLPYGTTSCKWDNIIPFEPLWKQYKRIIKDKSAIVLFGSEPFSTKLRYSNLDMFKYDWIWIKNNPVGFVNAKLKPMNKHEIISVFSKANTSNGNKNNMKYYPQGLKKCELKHKNSNKKGKDNTYWRPSMEEVHFQTLTNYPTTDLYFQKANNAIHPTQKPVALLEYLIRTYTNEGETVLDNCMGSGSTGIACLTTNRNFIGIELDEHYFNVAKNRIETFQNEYFGTQQKFTED